MTRPSDDDKKRPPGAPGRTDPVRTDLTTPPDHDQADLPHERDETVGMTGGIPDPVVQQGHEDLKRGLEDTSKAQETDRAYRKLRD